MKNSYRTICADGTVHAEFAHNTLGSLEKRCQEVVEFDNQQGCGPHTVEFSIGEAWFKLGVDEPIELENAEEDQWLLDFREQFDVRYDHTAKGSMGHVYQIKIDGEWKEMWFQSEAEGWMYIAGFREGREGK